MKNRCNYANIEQINMHFHSGKSIKCSRVLLYSEIYNIINMYVYTYSDILTEYTSELQTWPLCTKKQLRDIYVCTPPASTPLYYLPHTILMNKNHVGLDRFHLNKWMKQGGRRGRRQARHSRRYSAPLAWLISLCSHNLFTTLANCHLSRGKERSPD